jgi:hypothetical protein
MPEPSHASFFRHLLNRFGFGDENPQTGTGVFDCPQFSGASCPVHFGAARVDCALRGPYQLRQLCAVGFEHGGLVWWLPCVTRYRFHNIRNVSCGRWA